MSILVSDVKAAVQARGYGTDTTGQQLTLLQGLLRRLYGERRWRFLRNAGTVAVPPAGSVLNTAADTQHVDAVRLATATYTFDLEARPYWELADLIAEDTSPGQPQYWARRDDSSLLIYPSADQAYTATIEYIQRPTLPAADGTAIVWPEQHIDVLVWGVCISLAARQRDQLMYTMAKAEFNQCYAEMTRSYGFSQRQTGSEVGRWDGWDDVSR